MMRRPWQIGAVTLVVALLAALAFWRAQPAAQHQPAPAAARAARGVDDGKLSLLPVPLSGSATAGAAAAPSAAPPNVPVQSGAEPAATSPSDVRVSGSVVDALGGPVIGARVQARVTVMEPVVSFASTDDRGAFSIALAPGAYLLEGTAEAYSRAVLSVRAPMREVTLVLVAESSIAGRVVTDAGLGAAGVTVSVFNASGLRVPPILATSDEQGQFVVRGLPAGGYSLTATSPRFRGGPLWVNVGVGERAEGLELRVRLASAVTVRASVADQPCSEGQVVLAMTPRAFGTFDPSGVAKLVGIPPGTHGLTAFCRDAVARSERISVGADALELSWALDPGLSVMGTVLSAAGTPVRGVEVEVTEVLPEGARAPTPQAIHRCTSDAAGEFSCGGLTAGAYQVRAEGLRLPRSERVNVALQRASERIQLRLKPAGSIQVSFADPTQAERSLVQAYVRGADEWPIEGRRQGADVWFDNLPLGQYEAFAGQPVAGAVQPVALTADAQVAKVLLEVPAPQIISGSVRDEKGVPVVEAWVRALTSPQLMRVATEAARPVLTDAQGAFTLEVPTPGEYDVVCTSGAGEGRARQVQAGALDVRVAFATYGSLSGVVEAAGGTAPATFELEYARKGGPPGRASGTNGRWSLPWLAPGEYELKLRSDEGDAHATVVLAPGGNAVVRSRLEPAR